MAVFVLDRHKKPLMPCSEKRAKLLLGRKRAVVHRIYPFTIRLKDRLTEQSAFQPVVLKIDPGSKTTGVAVALEASHPEGVEHRASHLAEVVHKGSIVADRMMKRSAYRRGRRTRNLRYRQCRFNNRRRPDGWLTPSMCSRVGNVFTLAKRYFAIAPITEIHIESVKFDMQKMVNPEISGVEYQRGELFGVEIWEYLLEKWGRKCAYCGKENVPLEMEHITPKARGGTNRVSNLTLACEPCNRKKGTKTAAEFGHPEIQKKAMMPLKDAAAVNITRKAVVNVLKELGVVVNCWTGGRTKYNRRRLGIDKSHVADAMCVGDVSAVSGLDAPTLNITARGRGQYRRTRPDKTGFPKAYLPRKKIFNGFQTGDMVVATIHNGKYQGVHVGRISCRRIGFLVGGTKGAQGTWKNSSVKLLQCADGYGYVVRRADLA